MQENLRQARLSYASLCNDPDGAGGTLVFVVYEEDDGTRIYSKVC